MQDDKKIVINVAEGNQIHIREGKLSDQLPNREPNIIKISGDIKTVRNYLTIRLGNATGLQVVDSTKAVVTVNKTAKTITLALDPESYYGGSITGTLEGSDDLVPFQINKDKRFDRKSLFKLMKFSRRLFADSSQYESVIVSLQRMNVKVATEIIQAKDNKGNSTNSVDIKTDAGEGFLSKFVLNAPIFKGFDAQKIEVEICYDVVGNDVSFWLESTDLTDVENSAVDVIFADELKSCEGLVIIRK